MTLCAVLQVLIGSAIVFCKVKEKQTISVKSLVLRDNDARRRLDVGPPLDGILGVSLLAGVQEFTAGIDITREDRLRMMKKFRDNKARILIATDSVAKGIDVPNVTMVVHVSLSRRLIVSTVPLRRVFMCRM